MSSVALGSETVVLVTVVTGFRHRSLRFTTGDGASCTSGAFRVAADGTVISFFVSPFDTLHALEAIAVAGTIAASSLAMLAHAI